MNVLRRAGGFDVDSEAYVRVLLADPCSYCGKQTAITGRIEPDAATIDHIESHGDSHWSNLTASCSTCNGSEQRMPLVLSMLERQLRRDLTPIAEQLWLIKGRSGSRHRIEF
jgi:hypothetical protein